MTGMKTVTSPDGTVIAFDQVGSGAPLILVSGASCDRQVDGRHAEALAGQFTVLNYDRRGRGDSADTAPYEVEREIEDLAALAEYARTVGSGPATVLGLSSGAVLAARAAARLPFAALILWEPPFDPDPAGQQDTRRYAAELGELLAAGDREGAFVLFLGRVGVPQTAIVGMRRAPHWAKAVAIAPTLGYDAAVMADGRVPTRILATVTAPTLVLAGAASPPSLQGGARAAASAIPGAQFRLLDGQTHDVAPDILAGATAGFVSQAALAR